MIKATITPPHLHIDKFNLIVSDRAYSLFLCHCLEHKP